MKTTTRNSYIALIIVSILVLAAYWYWSTRVPTTTFTVRSIDWSTQGDNFVLRLNLATQADEKIIGNKNAVLSEATPTSGASSDVEAFITALVGYPFVISINSDNPGVKDGDVYIRSLPKFPSPLLPTQNIPLSSGTLKVTLG